MGAPLLLLRGPSRPEEVDVRRYEIMLILPAEADESVIGSAIDRITKVIEGGGGKVGNIDRWGKRRFAYEIDDKTEGWPRQRRFIAHLAYTKLPY